MTRDRVAAGRKAQRAGDSFENSVEAECRGYAMRGKALVERLRLTGRFVKGKGFLPGASPVDFMGDIVFLDLPRRFLPIRFDCKSFAGERWDFSEWKPLAKKHHQLKALREMAAFGGLAFALVQCTNRNMVITFPDFYDHPAWLVPLVFVETYILLGRWSVTAKELDDGCARIPGAHWLPAAVDLTGLTGPARPDRL